MKEPAAFAAAPKGAGEGIAADIGALSSKMWSLADGTQCLICSGRKSLLGSNPISIIARSRSFSRTRSKRAGFSDMKVAKFWRSLALLFCLRSLRLTVYCLFPLFLVGRLRKYRQFIYIHLLFSVH